MFMAVKKPRSSPVGEWLPTLTHQSSSPPWVPFARKPSCRYALREPPCQWYTPSFPCSISYTWCQCRHFHSPPARHRRTVLPPLCRTSPPSSRTYIAFSSTTKRLLLSLLLHKACTPGPSSFPQGRPIVSNITMLEEGQPSILLVQYNTLEILPHLSNLKLYSGPHPPALFLHTPSVRDPQTPIAYPFSTQPT